MIRIISQNKRYGLIDIILVILIVFNSGYAGANAVSATHIWMTELVILVICIYRMNLNGKVRQTVFKPCRQGIIIVMPMFFLLVSGLLEMNLYTSVRPMLLIICAYFVVSAYDYEDIVRGYQITITVICLINLIVFLSDAIGVELPTSEMIANNGSVYKNGIVFFKLMYGNVLANRYMACFWEPGLFASFILLGIVLMEAKQFNYKFILKIALYIFSLYTTKSAAGYIILPFAIMFLILKGKKNYRIGTLLISLSIIIALIIVYFKQNDILNALYSLNPDVFGKVLNSEDASNYARVASYETNIKLFLQRPIFGYGIGKFDIVYLELSNASQTSTSTYWLAICGIAGIFPSLMVLRGIFNFYNEQSILAKSMVLILMFMILNKEPHLNNLGTTLIIAVWNYTSKKNSNLINNEMYQNYHFEQHSYYHIL